MSRQLVENCNNSHSTPSTGIKKIAHDTSSKWPGIVPLSTPQKSADLRALVRSVHTYLGKGNPPARMLFRKTEKTINNKNVLITKLETELHVLRRENGRVTKKKRKAVPPDPNARFVSIEDIMRTKAAMSPSSSNSPDSDDHDDTDIASEIVVVVE